MRVRPFTVVALVASLVVPAAASAMTAPVIAPPTPDSLAASQPVFTWVLGPAGEYVSSISISTDATVDANGGLATTTNGTFLYPLQSVLTATPTRKLAAGTYFWNAGFNAAEGQPYERGYTPVQSFRINPYVKGLVGTFTQYNYIPALLASGSFVSNTKTAVVTCTVRKGAVRISSQKKVLTYMTIAARNNFYCSDLTVPERYDGQKLNLFVKVVSGGKVVSTVKFFRAI